jgi:hypothetical protein
MRGGFHYPADFILIADGAELPEEPFSLNLPWEGPEVKIGDVADDLRASIAEALAAPIGEIKVIGESGGGGRRRGGHGGRAGLGRGLAGLGMRGRALEGDEEQGGEGEAGVHGAFGTMGCGASFPPLPRQPSIWAACCRTLP